MAKKPAFNFTNNTHDRLERWKSINLVLLSVLGFSPVAAHATPYDPSLFRSIDGTENNQLQSELGSVGEYLLRGHPSAPDITATAYADGVDDPARSGAPSPREISNALSAQTRNMPNSSGLSAMVWYWGQWVDHDITFTEVGSTESLPIQVPVGDPQFDPPPGTGSKTIEFHRSEYADTTGIDRDNPRQQVNGITAWIDASNVYGSDPIRASSLKERDTGGNLTGRLKVSSTPVGDLLPYNADGLLNASLPMQDQSSLFLAGDVRANEQAGLTAMHTLFMREHNRLADRIAAADASLGGEAIYQQARKLVGAELQQITYNEFLPALLGSDALDPYTGYDETVNPNISNVFSTAAFRVGHTMLNSVLQRLNDLGEVISDGNLALRDAYFNPANIESVGIEPYLKGASEMYTQEIDTRIVEDVRSFMFGAPGQGGLDLASLNIQRGRDHGLPDYNTLRSVYGLTPITDFSEISSDPIIQMAFESLYGDIGTIDPWIGMLAEDHLMGASVGELLKTIISDQFERLRDGDRFWFEQDPFFTQHNPDLLAEVRNTRLSDIILNNTALTRLDGNVFLTGRVPEPATLALMGLGLAGIGYRRLKQAGFIGDRFF